jgi:hypothetical protein
MLRGLFGRWCELTLVVLGTLFGTSCPLLGDTQFTGWHEVPGHSTTVTSDTAVEFQKTLYLFGVGAGDHAHYMNVFDGTQWAGWRLVPGGGTTSLSDAAAVYGNKLYLFAIGTGDHAHYVNVFDGTQWAGWKAIGGSVTTTVADTATLYDLNPA